MAIAALLPMPRAIFTDSNGEPLAGGFVTTLVAGTGTLKQTWQDAAETTPNANPIVLDAHGSCLMYGSESYTLQVTDALGNLQPQDSGLTRIIPISDAVAPALGDTIANAQSVLGIPAPYVLQLPNGTLAAPSFPLVASATTGWYRHVSTPDPISGSTNTWCLVVDGNERYRFFNSVLSMNLPAGDNLGITDGGRVFHIGNDGVGYYVTTTTDHMLRVGSHLGLGPTIIFGDQAGGGTGFTGRFYANNWPFCFGNGGDLTIASNGVILDTFDPPNSVIRVTNGAGGTPRTAMAFYRTGATLVGSIVTTDTTTTYATTSDERLKTVIGPIANSGALIDALAPFWHTWTGVTDQTQYVGMSAQAVNAVIPGVVSPGKGTPGQSGFVPWMGAWSGLVPVLIAELQALRLRVAALEAKSPA